MHSKTAIVLLTAFLVLGCGPGSDSPPAQSPPPFPVPVVELNGSASQIGAEHGRRLADNIRILHERYLQPYLKNHLQKLVAVTAARAFESRMHPEHRAEIVALAQQLQLDEAVVLLAQCFLDLSPMTACSTITFPADASCDGIARFGRNLDFPSLNVADTQSVVMIYRPEGRYQFAAVGWPGLIGVLSGMNEHGLALANMEVTRGASLPTAMPYPLIYRTLLERCRTVNEAIQMLREQAPQTPNNLMLMDADGNRAVVEITLQGIDVRHGEAGAALVSTNHHRDQDDQTAGLCRRYDLLRRRSADQFGNIDVESIRQMLAAAAQGDMTLQSMVFEPSRRVIYLAAGANAPTRPLAELDLAPYFNR